MNIPQPVPDKIKIAIETRNMFRGGGGVASLQDPKGRVKAVDRRPKKPPQEGPGTRFLEITKEINVKMPLTCTCKQTLVRMNKWGVDGCRKHFRTLVKELQRNAKSLRRTKREKLTTAALAVWSGLAFRVNPWNPVPGMLCEAIRRDYRRLALQE